MGPNPEGKQSLWLISGLGAAHSREGLQLAPYFCLTLPLVTHILPVQDIAIIVYFTVKQDITS